MKDYYGILGVERGASKASIKKAYRKLVMQCHPDKNPGDKEAEKKFKLVSEAYTMLSNPEKMQAHQSRGGFRTGFSGFDINDMFRNHFGQVFTSEVPKDFRSMPRPGQNLQKILKVYLYDIIMCSKKLITLAYIDVCLKCNGTGASKSDVCTNCSGKGVIQQQRSNGYVNMITNVTCPVCRGMGRIIKEKCPDCNNGKINIKRDFEFTIPEGANNGSILSFAGQGTKGVNGAPNGDLIIKLEVVLPKQEDLNEGQLRMFKEMSNEL